MEINLVVENCCGQKRITVRNPTRGTGGTLAYKLIIDDGKGSMEMDDEGNWDSSEIPYEICRCIGEKIAETAKIRDLK
ncbi:hypothetical protein F0919_00425 [Taibaiella lutea]|uniref:Uncharacterized protein n=1 Tax=Taibaiella lutea TaxID=2608001 RepID=A0A5M6CSN9_9BACT|nr:hypothetical protein [Taibaiella lutea]KAA5536169.1 hypothetical protein F0919_00425 [Taibaiella lutea]